MRHSYRLEVDYNGKWVIMTGGKCGREFGVGYVYACRERPGPKLGVRLVRDDGKVVEEAPGTMEAGIGMVAGFPTAEQYRAAAERCIQRAEAIEEMEQRRTNRRMQ